MFIWTTERDSVLGDFQKERDFSETPSDSRTEICAPEPETKTPALEP
jgi:hypothetical protein